MRIFFPVVAVLITTGCASPVQQATSEHYTVTAMQAQARGDWDTARKSYARAVVNAEQARLPARRRAILTYEYGRALGVTCYFDLAEAELNTAYTLDKEAGQPLYLSLVELSRLTLDQGKYQSSIGYFDRALAAMDAAQLERISPAEYGVILEEYAQALTGAGRDAEASSQKTRAADLREKTRATHSITDRTPYGKKCTKP